MGFRNNRYVDSEAARDSKTVQPKWLELHKLNYHSSLKQNKNKKTKNPSAGFQACATTPRSFHGSEALEAPGHCGSYFGPLSFWLAVSYLFAVASYGANGGKWDRQLSADLSCRIKAPCLT